MTTMVILPRSGMGIDEGTIVRWLKTEGDAVQEGELIAEVETAKAIQEVEAPATGILSRILVAEGETVDVNADIAVIDDGNG